MNRVKYQRYFRRLRIILGNSIHGVVAFPIGILISSVVIRLASADLWGSIVGLMVIAQLASHILAWGNQEYLIREFSRNPTGISNSWMKSLANRLVLVPIPILLILGAGYTGSLLLWGLAWSIGLFLRQAFQPLVVFRRDFVVAVVIEIITTSAAAAAIYLMRDRLDLLVAVQILSLQSVARASLLMMRFLGNPLDRPPRLWPMFDRRYLWVTGPFFLLSMSGMLNSRVDLYLVTFLRSDAEAGIYQILTTIIIFLQSLSALILTPFVKNLYRLEDRVIPSLSTKFLFAGVVLIPLALLLAYLLLPIIYGFSIPAVFFLVSGILVLPTYIFLPIIYGLYKHERQVTVLKINLLSAGMTTILSVFLIPAIGLIGALASAAASRWAALILYRVQLRSLPGQPTTSPEYSIGADGIL